jgi:hypothetical protein
MLRPTTIPQSLYGLQGEHALAREALRLALDQHKSLATGLKGTRRERTLALAEELQGEASLVQMQELDLIVGSGGVLSHAPRRSQAALMLLDAFEPAGVTRLAVDSIFMMPQLGVLSQVNPQAARQVFFRDCLVPLGTCVAPLGRMRSGQPAVTVRYGEEALVVTGGELVALSPQQLGADPVELIPSRGLDLGAGRGQRVRIKSVEGVVGLIVDCRGRPLRLPEDQTRAATVAGWYEALDLYPGEGGHE